jgi:predicted phage-related endonuclease
MIERIPIENTKTGLDAWLGLRKRDITASSVGALFACHPYQTTLGLYTQKCGLDLPEPDTAMLEWRLILESAVGASVARQRPGWKIVKATEYLRDPDLRLGATPDFYILGDPRGLGILQAKTIAPAVFKKTWTDDTPPLWIALQNTTELMLDGNAAFGAVACLIIDPWKCECPIYEVPRHAGAEQRIREAVAKFWDDVRNNREPAPDYARDAEVIAAMSPVEKPGKTIIFSGDNELPIILAERAGLKGRIKVDEDRCKAIETEVKHKMGDAEIGVAGDFTLTFRTQNRKAYSVVATSFRPLRVIDKRPAQDKREGF